MTVAKDRLGFGLLAACLVLLAAIAGGGLALERRQPRFDPSTGCVVGEEPSGDVLALIDLTDPITSDQESAVREHFARLAAAGLRANERVTLWTLSGARAGALQRRFCRCSPARAVNPLFDNEQFAAARSESLFAAPLRRALRELPQHETAAASPLLQAIAQICAQPEFQRARVPRRLILVSNLEQNDGVVSVYTSRTTATSFTSLPESVLARPDLRSVAVEVLYLPRGRWARSLDPTLQDAWRSYFLACGADRVQISRL